LDIGWKVGIDFNGNARKVKSNYCSKMVSGRILRFKHHIAKIREDFMPCASVSEKIKKLMLKIVA